MPLPQQPMAEKSRYRNSPRFSDNKSARELKQNMVVIRRVSKTNKKGRQMHPSAMIVVGDGAGKIACANKGAKELADALQKAYNVAQARLRRCVIWNKRTIPYDVNVKFGATRILMKHARPGTGIIACEAMRSVFEVVGIKDIVTKVINYKSKINVVRCAIQGLYSIKLPSRKNKQKVIPHQKTL